MKKILFILSIFLLSTFLVLIYFLSPTSLSGEKTRFVVGLDTKQEDIASQLKKENFIKSVKIFGIITTMMKFPGTIEPGAYNISHNMNLFSIADTLLNHPFQKWVALTPGLRIEQTAEKLAEKLDWDETKTRDFLDNSNEGYMFPDTYLINLDYTGKQTAQKLISNFNEKFDSQIMSDLLKNNIRNDTAIKIASLIERESGGDDDKALIAGIILNRLNTGMKLQIDATIQYAMGAKGDWWPKVTVADYKLDSPYNTYLISRLPPTPICNPGLSSIKAIANPKETDCIFYLHDHEKQIHCAVTYAQHLENIEKYLK